WRTRASWPSSGTTTAAKAVAGTSARASAAATGGGSASREGPWAQAGRAMASANSRDDRNRFTRGIIGPAPAGPSRPRAANAPMRAAPCFLASETSTDALSLALGTGRAGEAVHRFQGPGGAQASTELLPQVRRLLAEAGRSLDELDAIAFGRGPGSFT